MAKKKSSEREKGGGWQLTGTYPPTNLVFKPPITRWPSSTGGDQEEVWGGGGPRREPCDGGSGMGESNRGGEAGRNLVTAITEIGPKESWRTS